MTDRRIRQAIDNGCRNAGEVYAFFGVSPRCGRCMPEVCRLLNENEARSGEMIAAE
ncbi:MAG: (2Fe-2S)-binding protein [Rhodospirillales bacterium]|nr:(2Fe-2S)-binding protein [Rhodospirillales bacterium]